MNEILKVENLKINLKEDNRNLIKNTSFILKENEVLALVGESGSGKSITSQAIIRLLDERIFKIDGTIFFENKNLLALKERDMCKLRGNEISMIYQEPFMAMNPLMKIGKQVEECIKIHSNLGKRERKERVLDILEKVKLVSPRELVHKYPYELSGGQLQRVMIAMALITKPKILIADEPTTALDVTIQKEIIFLLKELKDEFNMSILFITHDLGIVAEIADRVSCMYKGQILETANVVEFFDNPKNEYSKKLLLARPKYF